MDKGFEEVGKELKTHDFVILDQYMRNINRIDEVVLSPINDAIKGQLTDPNKASALTKHLEDTMGFVNLAIASLNKTYLNFKKVFDEVSVDGEIEDIVLSAPSLNNDKPVSWQSEWLPEDNYNQYRSIGCDVAWMRDFCDGFEKHYRLNTVPCSFRGGRSRLKMMESFSLFQMDVNRLSQNYALLGSFLNIGIARRDDNGEQSQGDELA